MNSTHEEKIPAQVPTQLSDTVLRAIRGALQEEKQPKWVRFLKVLGSTLVGSAVLALPFLLSFRDQLNWAWGAAWAICTVILLVGFLLHFYPQPRLMLSGVWSPFVLARILLVATVSTVIQILVCPSFVFLSSPFEWNPLFPITNALIRLGGMNLCMFFCGFFFSFVSSLIGLLFVKRVAKDLSWRALAWTAALLVCSQLPVLSVQILSEELRSFSGFWAMGLVLASLVAIVVVRSGHSRPRES